MTNRKTGHESRCMGIRHVRCITCGHILSVHDDDWTIGMPDLRGGYTSGCLACVLLNSVCYQFRAAGVDPDA